MRARDIIAAIVHLYHNRTPGMLWGPPGVGKTDVVNQAGVQLKKELVSMGAMREADPFGVIDFRIALRDPTDIKGYPMADLKTGTMRFLHDEQLPRSGHGILFFDEMNNGTPATQACGMQLTLARRIGTYELPEGWFVMASGNRLTDRGVTYDMPTPLKNRFKHIEMEVNTEDWVDWALRNGMSPELVAFHRWKTNQLFTFDPKSGANAFGTPRSWAATDAVLKDHTLQKHVKYELMKGTVGDGPAGEYMAFIDMQAKLPTFEDIENNPLKAHIQMDEPSILYSLTTMVATHVTAKNFDKVTKFTGRLPMEFQALFIRDVLKRHPDIKDSKVFQKWSLDNAQILV